MQVSSLLAIAIPTYQRADILEDNIYAMMAEIEQLSLAIYVSDDSRDYDTERAVERLRQHYPHIYYRRNTPSLGHDENCSATLRWPTQDYVWYLGDSMLIEPGALARVHQTLASFAPDFVFLNSDSRVADVTNSAIPDMHYFLQQCAWHLTLTGATIYGARVIKALPPELSPWRNFPQLGLILEFATQQSVSAFWLGGENVRPNLRKKSYWNAAVVQTFATDWANLLLHFASSFPRKELTAMLISHSIHARIFNVASLIRYRAANALSLSIAHRNKAGLKLSSQTSYSMVVLISCVPVALCRAAVQLSTRVRARQPRRGKSVS